MAVLFHMKDGQTITLPNAVSVGPWPGDDNFVQAIGTSSNPGEVSAICPVASLDVAEVQ